MLTTNLEQPVTTERINRYGNRLDASTYLSGAVEAEIALERLDVVKEPLQRLTCGHAGGIYNGPQFTRVYVEDPAHGVPFITASSMLLADLSGLAFLSREDAFSAKLRHLEIEPGMTLISCSGTIGRTVYARPDLVGVWGSQDVLKVVPDRAKILPGYLFSFLASRFGTPMITSGTYGSIIQHLEPAHIANLPVPRLGERIEVETHRLVEEAARLRARFQALLAEATNRVFASVGLRDIQPHEWHQAGSDLGFTAWISDIFTLRALNYNPRAERLLARLREAPHCMLGEICAGGMLARGPRFTRVEADPAHESAIRLVGQKQAFWIQPEGRWISQQFTPAGVMVPDETILVASQGTLGENEVFAHSVFVTGAQLEFAYTEHFLRIVSGGAGVPGAYLFAFLRSDTAFRLLRSTSVGSKQQDLHPSLVARIPVPMAPEPERSAIAELVRDAFRGRDEADQAEAEAIRLVERAITT